MKVRAIIILAVTLVFNVFTVPAQAANPADIYPDNKVDWLDMMIMANDWLSDGNTPADIDNNGDVNGVDFAILAHNWGWIGPSDDMVLIPSGEFLMGDYFAEGDSDELPIHTVTLDSFYMSKYEITNQQFCDYLNSAYPTQIEVVNGVVYAIDDTNKRYPYCTTSPYFSYSQINYSSGVFSVKIDVRNDMPDHPIFFVYWYGSVAYCNWKSQQEGLEICYDTNDPNWYCDFTKNGYRLPTEAEWEYAARGGNHSPYYRYPWGDMIDGSMANYQNSGDPYEGVPFLETTPVGYYDGGQTPTGVDMANGYGLYDMTGNVTEWCNDWYDSSYYSSSPESNPTGPASVSDPNNPRVRRGSNFADSPSFDHNRCRVAERRGNYAPAACSNLTGFRVCRKFFFSCISRYPLNLSEARRKCTQKYTHSLLRTTTSDTLLCRDSLPTSLLSPLSPLSPH